ncbi:MAG: hypothetical protein FWG43_03240 [Clostridiales bacterium]|nr:hypothetical protein [Clostridiales bacterium]
MESAQDIANVWQPENVGSYELAESEFLSNNSVNYAEDEKVFDKKKTEAPETQPLLRRKIVHVILWLWLLDILLRHIVLFTRKIIEFWQAVP